MKKIQFILDITRKMFYNHMRCRLQSNMVDVVQLVRAPDCGSGGRGFESHHPPHFFPFFAEKSPPAYWDIAKSVRQRTLTPSFRRFESCYPSQTKKTCYGKSFFVCVCVRRTRHRLTACGQHHFVRSTNIVPIERTQNGVATSRKQCYTSHKQCCLRQTMLHFVQKNGIIQSR